VPNTSATGGYLTPTTTPDDDVALALFMQTVIVGVTGLAGTLVRREWQVEPGAQPAIDVNWCAFGVATTQADDNPYERYNDADDDSSLVRQEEFELSCIFYGPNCQGYAKRLRDGLCIAQNREAMFVVGISFASPAAQVIHVPELINNRWHDRADVTLTFRRQISRDYDILSLLDAYGTIETDNGLEIDWTTGFIDRIFDNTFDETFG
jgi:hypothetical protein